MGIRQDLSGKRFGRLEVIKYSSTKASPDGTKRAFWVCKCACGNIIETSTSQLTRGKTVSCGCYNNEKRCTHKMTHTRLYGIWKSIRCRCGLYGDSGCSPSTIKNYVQRGITIDDKNWLRFEPFMEWSLSHGYNDGLEIDRVDNSKGYSPENCRWVSHKQNQNNRRNTLRLPNGQPLTEFCEIHGIKTKNGSNKSKEYHTICEYFRRTGKLHPKYFVEQRDIVEE